VRARDYARRTDAGIHRYSRDMPQCRTY